MLTLEHVTKDYGRFRAVEDISLDLENGLYGMLAPNGAGKTTILKMIATLLFPTEGEILYNGMEIRQMGEAYRELLGYLPQQFGYYKNNTPVQYLEYLALLKGMERRGLREKVTHLLDEVGLSSAAGKKMKGFSGGMIQRVGIAQAILNDPKILILDEPTAGLDPRERVRFRNIISKLSKDRIVILSTHIVSDIESIADQVILIRSRRLYKMDTVADLCQELSGCIYECNIPDGEYEDFSHRYLVLSAKQERDAMRVRYYMGSGDGQRHEPSQCCIPDLEDVFLVAYQEGDV